MYTTSNGIRGNGKVALEKPPPTEKGWKCG